jgi:predicted TPR repeat methyltransferase
MNVNYDNLSKKYDSVRITHRYIQDILNEYICSKSNKHTHVDLGCGTCKETFMLKDRVKNFIGIDLSPEMLEIAREKIQRGVFMQADLQTNIPLSHNTADSVTIISFYHHIVNKSAFFSEVNRIMDKSGILIIITNTIEQLEKRGYYDFFKTALSINKRRFLDKDNLESILRKNNFSIIESTQISRPVSFWGEELLPKIQSLAFDSVFNLIDKTNFNKGLKKIKIHMKESKIACCRDRYLIVCEKGEQYER